LLTRYIYGFLEKINLEQLLQDEAHVIQDVDKLGAKPQSLSAALRTH
jgi:hypothetical protein